MSKGSSPRLRGTLPPAARGLPQRGIIPALAGNTSKRSSHSLRPWDHPRACGEHPGAPNVEGRRLGSSPRLRGTHHAQGGRGHGRGIIPALAGNTGTRPAACRRAWDHPRACGEHFHRSIDDGVLQGSSPRLRGTHGVEYGWVIVIGIIPALAGNTPPLYKSGALTWDHPRACGEHPIARVSSAGIGGSSPRLRGTPAAL